MSIGLSCLKCALAAMVTELSVMPEASFARVLPVQGEIISASRGFSGPRGSASATEQIISRPQSDLTREENSLQSQNLVSVEQARSLMMG